MPSTQSCSRAPRSSERGIALVLALVLAVLYFGLIELLLLDSARELGEARRFRARIMAETLAENGAELAALQIVSATLPPSVQVEDWQGTATGKFEKWTDGKDFVIEGVGRTSGITESSARVRVVGRVVEKKVYIQYTLHSYPNEKAPSP